MVSYFYLKHERIREYFRQPGACDAHTILVHSNAFGGSEPLAEAHRLRTVELILFPVRIQRHRTCLAHRGRGPLALMAPSS